MHAICLAESWWERSVTFLSTFLPTISEDDMSANEGYSLQILFNTASLSSALSHGKSFGHCSWKVLFLFYHNLDLNLILFSFYLYCPCFLFFRARIRFGTYHKTIYRETANAASSQRLASWQLREQLSALPPLVKTVKFFRAKMFFLVFFFSLLWIQANDRRNQHYFWKMNYFTIFYNATV